jgi:ABC-type cobalamin/Fe3+-siderophores transport system ATPase subunit
MKLNYLKVNGYKNLQAKAVFDDINSCENYLALIGLNGSGKSNVLEAISKIFASLYSSSNAGFTYEIRYNFNGNDVVVIDGTLTNGGIAVKKKDIRTFLPEQVIACYSGEERRLWEDVYETFYFDFFKKVLGNAPSTRPDMLYLNKYSWNLALIALMCSEKQTAKDFLKEVLNIVVDETITIDFTLDLSKYPSYTKNNEVLELINRINPEPKAANKNISINTLRTFEIGAANNNDFVKRVFLYLYIASMPQRNKVIKADKIITDIKINFNGLDVKSLSEGEKKLLLIKAIIDILGNENSLFLFDEPDSHVHVSRKKEVKKYIDKENHFSVLTTHSPALLHSLKDENVRILSNGEDGLEVIPVEKVKAIEKLSDGAFTLMDATLAFATRKDLLLVEGFWDYQYITKAIEVLKRTQSPKYDNLDLTIINCGGEDNISKVLEQAILDHIRNEQLCIALFDDDTAGKSGRNDTKALVTAKGVTNVKTLLLPKIPSYPAGNDFMIEDYFPIAIYKTSYTTKVTTASYRTELNNFPNPKNEIKNTFKGNNIADGDYDNFMVLLDKIIKLQTDFRPI